MTNLGEKIKKIIKKTIKSPYEINGFVFWRNTTAYKIYDVDKATQDLLKLFRKEITQAVNSIELEKKNKDWKRTEQDPTEDELASIDGYNQAVDDFNEQKAKLIEELR